jgi:xanthine dehydrogenase YagS FAD-binding subunit
MLPQFTYVRPRSLHDTMASLDQGPARIHAGGTDLLGCLRDGIFTTERIVSIAALDELRGIRNMPDGSLHIGALTTIAEVAANARIRRQYTALAEAAEQVSSPQLRNQGTLGGNLCQKPRCWYYRGDFDCLRKGGDTCFAFAGENRYHCIFGGDTCFIVHPSDTAPALVALGALTHIVAPTGSRSLAVEKLHVPPSEDPQREVALEPSEVLTEVIVPTPAAGLRSSYRKVRERGAWDFALAGVALALVFDGDTVTSARVVLSGVAPVPWRAREAEAALEGARLDAKTIRAAARAAVAGAEPLEQNAYKVPLVTGLVEEQLERMAQG